MYKYVIEKLKDIYNYCMSLNFKYVFICRIFFFDAFICHSEINDICMPS